MERTQEIGLTQRIFNSQAIALADLNGDGKLDLILNNEGQDSAILFGNKDVLGKNTAVAIQLTGDAVGGRLRVLDNYGKALCSHEVSGGEGRGGELARNSALRPAGGAIQNRNLRTTNGRTVTKDITVADTPLRVKFTAQPMSSNGTK